MHPIVGLILLPWEFVRRMRPRSTTTNTGSGDWKSSGKTTWGAQISSFMVQRLLFSCTPRHRQGLVSRTCMVHWGGEGYQGTKIAKAPALDIVRAKRPGVEADCKYRLS